MNKDKKQILVVGVLGLAMLAIGAFQFLAPKRPAVVAPDSEVAESNASSEEVAVNEAPQILTPEEIISGFLGDVDPRDPFLAQAVIVKPPKPNDVAPPVGPKPPRPSGGITGGGGYEPVDPNVNGGGVISGDPLIQPGEFAFKLKGVLIGANSNIAVFEDTNGNQRLVGQGSKFGVESKSEVISISASTVTIRHRGKIITLSLEEG